LSDGAPHTEHDFRREHTMAAPPPGILKELHGIGHSLFLPAVVGGVPPFEDAEGSSNLPGVDGA